ncbi:MAG: TldD/PmbA family protein [Thermoproteota archaeon]|nr:TldD/PmbA family protein [Candidatus Brockarchaeota archaeon]
MKELELCLKGIKLAEELGASQAEAVALIGRSVNLSIERNSIKGIDEGSFSSFGIRVYVGKSIGISTVTSLEESKVETVVKNAIELAKSSPPDENFVSLPESKEFIEVFGLYDRTIEDLTSEELVSNTQRGIHALKDVDKTLDAVGGTELFVTEKFIANSLGVERSQKASGISFGIEALKKGSNGDIGTGFDYFFTRTSKELKFEEVGINAANKAIKNVGRRGVKSGTYTLILDERATLGTIGSIVGYGANAFYILQKSSYYVNKIGTKVANEQLNVLDDPLYPYGWSSTPFDSEGYPSSKVKLIENGILTNYITDSYTANALKIENNGHAGRGGLVDKPRPRLTNLQIASGEYEDDELFKDVKQGIYIYDSSLSPVEGSSNISSLVDYGFLIEEGEIKYPVKNTMVGSTVFEILQSIDAVGKKTKNEAGRIAPKIRIRNIKVSS